MRSPPPADAVQRLLELREQLRPQLSEATDGRPPLVAASETLAIAGLRVDRAEALSPDPALGRPNARMRLSVAGPFAAFFQLQVVPVQLGHG